MTEEEINKLMLKTGIPWPYKFRILKDTTQFMALDMGGPSMEGKNLKIP